MLDIEDGLDVAAGNRTLNEQFKRYMQTKHIKQSSKSLYEKIWKLNVEEGLGKMRLADIRKSDLQIFYKSLKDEGLSDSYIHTHHNMINPTFELAVDDDIIRKNPNRGCMKEYTDKPKEKEIPTSGQQEAFLEYVRNSERYDYYYPLFQVMFSTALRYGEVTGLTWDDVDFKERIISINHQLTYTNYGDGYKYHCETLKTDAGERIIPMTKKCYKALKMQREYCFAFENRGRDIAGLKGLVFLTPRGNAYRPSSLWRTINTVTDSYNEYETEKAKHERREAVLLPHITPHTYRHTGCTRLAEAKMDIKSLQEFMGHSDINTTMNIYNHVTDDRVKKEIEEAEAKSNVI